MVTRDDTLVYIIPHRTSDDHCSSRPTMKFSTRKKFKSLRFFKRIMVPIFKDRKRVLVVEFLQIRETNNAYISTVR